MVLRKGKLMNYEWTTEDEIELVGYEKELQRSEFVRKHAGWLVGGVIAIVTAGFVTLAVLLATA